MAKETYAIVLAAGASRRMGRPKQLLPYGGSTILRHVLDSLLTVQLTDIYVILGHAAEEVRRSIRDVDVRICVKDDPDAGMLSSLRVVLSALPATAGIIHPPDVTE